MLQNNMKIQSAYVPERRKTTDPFRWQNGYLEDKLREVRGLDKKSWYEVSKINDRN